MVSIPAAQRRALEERGFVVIPDALEPGLLARLRTAHEGVCAGEKAAGRLAADGSLHALGALDRGEAFLELLDLPAVLPLVREVLGWNIYAYHSHVDAHPASENGTSPVWRWHQDGGRQNVELESEPRPRLSLKAGYFLTDVLEPGAGALRVLPGSHVRNAIPRPEAPALGFEEPEGAEPVLVPAGGAVVFDRRLWHARGENRSGPTRRAVFVAYTYRWIRPRESPVLPARVLDRLSPVRRQLLGIAASELGHWLPTEGDVPLRG